MTLSSAPPIEPLREPRVGSVGRLCPACAKPVDPLRAGQVAVIDGAFVYYCDAACKRAHLERGPTVDEQTAAPPDVAVEPASARASSPSAAPPSLRTPEPLAVVEATLSGRPAGERRVFVAGSARLELAQRAAMWLAIGAAVLSVVMLSARGEAGVPELLLLGVATIAASFWFVVGGGDPAEASAWLPVSAMVAMTAGTILIRARGGTPASSLFAASVSLLAQVAVESATRRALGLVAVARGALEAALETPVRVVHGDSIAEVPAKTVRPGEIVVARAGEVLAADGVVVFGQADVFPWREATNARPTREGDAVVAGARVQSGEIRLQITRTLGERAMLRLAHAPETRVDVVASLPRAVRRGTEGASSLLGIVVGLVFGALTRRWGDACVVGASVLVALSSRSAVCTVAMLYARAHLSALARGIVYRDADAFERATVVDQVVYCARGTLLLGEPEIIAVESLVPSLGDRVLELAAAVGTVCRFPLAVAVGKGAALRSLRPDGLRNVVESPGLGVICSTGSGESLVVGSRALLLREKISVAIADARVSEIEAEGRSVLLVALAGKLLGFVALQDGLTKGARASVQRLLAARVEPVLLSADARETCEAFASTLEIEHTRPEVLPPDRGAEVRALMDAGHVVAVVGHPVHDDGPLEAASLSIALPSRGAKFGDCAVELLEDDVLDASFAVTLPRRARERALLALVAGTIPGIVAALAITFGVAAPLVAPIAALVQSSVLFFREREQPARS